MPFKRFLEAPSPADSEAFFLECRKRDEKLAETVMLKYNSQRLNTKYDLLKSPFSADNKELEMKSASVPWWKDDKYVVGLLTKKPRYIKIMNTMIMRDVTIEVSLVSVYMLSKIEIK